MNHISEAAAGDLYRLMVQTLPDSIIVLTDDTLHVLSAEGGDRHLLSESRTPLAGLALAEIIPAQNYPHFETACRAALLGRPQELEINARGRIYEVHAVPIKDPAVPNAALLVRLADVTRYKQSNHALDRADHAYQTLSAGNRALLRARSEQELLDLVCQVAEEVGGYRMAWVGFAERDEQKTLRPVAWAGREAGFLTTRPISWADSVIGQRPGPKSVRTGKPVIIQHIASAVTVDQDWREDAQRLGFEAVMGAPLLDDDGSPFGCMVFYSEVPDAFDPREAQLLLDLAASLAYGIRALRMSQMRNNLVETLQESEARFRLISERSLAGIYIIQDGHYTYINPAMAGIYGYTRKEMAAVTNIIELVHPDDRGIVAENIRKREAGEVESIHYEVRCIRKDGEIIHVEALGSRVEYQGKPAVIGMILDITKRVHAEQAEREQRRLAEALAATAASLINTLDSATVLRKISEGLHRVMNPECLLVMSGRENVIREVLVRKSESSTIADVLPVKIHFNEVPVLGEMARTCQMVCAPEGSIIDTGWVPDVGLVAARSLVGVPICVDRNVLGFVLLLSATAGALGEAQGQTAQAFADQAATALKNVDLYRELNTYNDFLEDAIESATAEMRRVKEQMEGIVINDPKAVLLLASDGSIKLSNPAFERLFGYDGAELRGQELNMVVAPRDVPTLEGALHALLAQRVTMYLDLHALRKSREEFDIQMALAPITDSERLIGIVCDVHDVSSFKEVERLKDAFVSNVSHELRTPITSMRLNNALMRQNPGKMDVYLDRQSRDVDRLGKLIEDLLQLSRLDQGRGEITLRPLDINAWASSLIDEYAILATQHDQTLTLDAEPGLPPVEADSGFLAQVLANLLNNAMNYTQRGGIIRVSTLKRRSGDAVWVGFSVSDNGPGISPEDQERLFERFFRGRVGRAASAPGTGLGLSIAREIVALHHGQIELESSGIPGEGTQFSIWLPMIKEKVAG